MEPTLPKSKDLTKGTTMKSVDHQPQHHLRIYTCLESVKLSQWGLTLFRHGIAELESVCKPENTFGVYSWSRLLP